MLPITINTHNRTEYCIRTIKSIFTNLVINDEYFIYICDDRSSQNHIDSIIELFKEYNFNNYKIISCNNNNYGYGYVLNTALDDCYKYSDIALTMEDDWILYRKFDINPVYNFLLYNSHTYSGIRLCCSRLKNRSLFDNFPLNFGQFKSIYYNSHYVNQCMLRHKSIFEKIRFLENVNPHILEKDLKSKYINLVLKPKLNHLLMLYYTYSDGKPIFKHIGKETTMIGDRNLIKI